MVWLLTGCWATELTELRTEVHGLRLGTGLEGWSEFESGDPVLEGSRVCLTFSGSECVRLSGESQEFGSSNCFQVDGLGEHRIALEPVAEQAQECSEVLAGPDQVRLEAVGLEGLSAELYWPIEALFQAEIARVPDAELLGPDFFFEGLVPPPGVELQFEEGANVYLSAQVFDAQGEAVEWAAPWRVDIDDASRPSWVYDQGRSVGGEGGEIALRGPGGESLSLGEWRPWTAGMPVEARLHVFVGHPGDTQSFLGAATYAWMELGAEGVVIRQRDTDWSLIGAPDFVIVDDGQPGLGRIEPELCALDIEPREERLVVVARALGETKRQRVSVPVPGLGEDPDDWARYEELCGEPPRRARRGCSTGPKGSGLGLVLGALLLLRRRRLALV